MDVKLTKDADKYLCLAFAEYTKRRKDGMRKRNAGSFEAQWFINALKDETRDDAMETIASLTRQFGVKMYMDGGFELSDEMIVYMESKFPEGIRQVVEALSTLFGIVGGAYGMLK